MPKEFLKLPCETDDVYRLVVDNASDAILSIDENKNIIFVNRAAETIFGYPCADLIGKPFDILAPLDLNAGLSNGLAPVAESDTRDSVGKVLKLSGRRRDNSNVSLEISTAESRHGAKRVFIIVARDITERLLADESFAESQAMLALAVKSSGIGVWEQDLTTDTVNWSPELEEVFGLSNGDFNRTTSAFYELVHEDDRQTIWAEVQNAIIERREYEIEFRFYHADGAIRWMEGRGRAFYAENGQPVRLYGTGVDITDRKKAEELLRKSSRELIEMADAMPQVVWIADANGLVNYYNSRVSAFYGGLGKPDRGVWNWQPFVYEEDLDLTIKAWEEAVQRESPYSVEHRIRMNDGTFRWHLSRAFPVKNGDEIEKWYGTATDIDEVKRAHEALRASEERFRVMADNAPVMVWVTDPTGYCNYLNQSWYEFTGQTPETGLGLGWVDSVHPDDREFARESFIESNKNRQAFNVEYRFRRHDGEYFWAIDSAQPRFDESGEYLGYIGTVVNINDRKQAEEQIKYQLDLTETITDNTQSCLLMMDENSVCTFANHATERVTGFKPEELLGEILHEKIHHTRPDGTPFPIEECPLDNALPIQEAVVGYEDVFVHKNGHFYPVRCAGRPIFKNGKPIGTVIEVEDITVEKRIEAERGEILEREQKARLEAEEANRAKDEFLSVLSHELRTPLNAILGWTRMLKSGALDEAKNRQAVETIERNARLQNNLIEDLLDVSRIISGKMGIESEKLDLTSVVVSAMETMRPSAEIKNIAIRMETAPEALEICGDPTRLQQIIVNLANNAVKFTPPGGTITVRLSKHHEKARLEISDTGIGIGAELLPHIFDRFRQADSTTQRNHSGLGLGLTIVHHLVELHEGTVSAKSDGDGKGATFIVEIPLLGRAESGINSCQPSVPIIDKIPEENVLRGKLILLVDDDCDGLQPLKLFLELHGAEAVCADSAEQGLREFERRAFDLILSDIGMPLMNGYEFINRIRKLAANSEVPAIALTAYASADDRNRAMSAGFQMHYAKPLNFEKLLQTVVEILSSAKNDGE